MPSAEMDEDRMPDRHWFWAVVATIAPDFAKLYVERVLKIKHESKPRLERKTITVSERWLQRLV